MWSGSKHHPSREPTALLRPKRRDLLKLLGVGATAGLAGCAGQNTDSTPTEAGSPSSPGGGDGGTDGGGGVGNETPPSGGERTIKGTYTSAVGSDAQSLNWLSVADTTSGSYIGNTLDGAWAVTPELDVFPLWADVSSDDKRVYEISLRDHLEWSDPYGQMTAEDWVYMITNVFQAEDNWAGYPSADDWFAGEEPIPIEKTGTYTFEVQLPETDPAWPLKPVMWGQECMPKGLLEKYVPDKDAEGLKQDQEIQTLAYTGNLGPYTYEKWDRESQFVTTRNDAYYMHEAEGVPEAWTDAPYFERDIVKVIPEESSRLAALKTGEITSAGIPPDKAKQFSDLEDIYLNVAPQPFVSILALNQRANGWTPFRNRDVRVAAAQAIDKTSIVENILRGFAEPAHTMQPQFSKWYDDSQVEKYGIDESYGAEVARSTMESALSETNYSYSGDVLEGPNGEQVELQLVFSSSSPTNQTVGEFIAQEYEKNLGIEVSLKGVPGNTFLSKYAANSPPKGANPEWTAGKFNGGPRDVSTSDQSWDISVSLSFNTYPRTPTSTEPFFTEKGTINYYGYVPAFDFESLYKKASTAVDETVRKQTLAEIFGKISIDQPFVFLAMESSIAGYQNNVVGPKPEFGSGWDSQTWYFK